MQPFLLMASRSSLGIVRNTRLIKGNKGAYSETTPIDKSPDMSTGATICNAPEKRVRINSLITARLRRKPSHHLAQPVAWQPLESQPR